MLTAPVDFLFQIGFRCFPILTVKFCDYGCQTMAGIQADLVILSGEDRSFLEGQVRRHKVPRSLSDRCRMILLCADGLQSKEVAERLGVHEHTVGKWRRRFVQDGIEGLTDEYRSGRPRTVSDAQVAQVIEHTLNSNLDL